MHQADQHGLLELLNELPEAVCCLDSAVRITHISQGYAHLTGISTENILGMELFDLLIEEDREPARNAFGEALLEQQRSMQIRVRLAGATATHWADLEIILKLNSPLLGASSLAIFHDAGSRVQLESRLAQQQRELTAINEQLEHSLSQSHGTLIAAGETFRSQLQSLQSDSAYYSLRIVSHPSYFIGGDVFFYRETRRGSLLVALADAVGHGPAAALRGVAIKATALSCLHHNDDPLAMLVSLNEHAADYLEEGAYFTIVLIEVDFQLRKVNIFNCGGPPLLLFSKRLASISANNPPLGLYTNIHFRSHSLAYQPPAYLLLLSDGWLEPQSQEGRVMPIQAAQVFAHFATGEEVSEAALKAAVISHTGDVHFMDDLSAIQVKLKPR